MKPQVLKEEISQLMETISEQVEMINSESDKIPQIEVDLVMANLRKLYEVFCELDRLNRQPVHFKTIESAPEQPAALKTSGKKATDRPDEVMAGIDQTRQIIPEETKPEETEPEETEPEETEPEETEPEPIPMVEEVEFIRFEMKPPENMPEPLEKTPQPEVQDVNEIPFQAEEPVKPQTPGSFSKPPGIDLFSGLNGSTITEKYKTEGLSVRDKFKNPNEDKTLAEKIHQTQVRSLRSAIGINEKFIFCNELFDQETIEYEETIHKLDNFRSLDEAMTFWRFLKERYRWNEKSESYQNLYSLLKMRYL